MLRDEKGQWQLPLNGAVTSHILKQAPAEFPHLLENELYCMALAGACGLKIHEKRIKNGGRRFRIAYHQAEIGPDPTWEEVEKLCIQPTELLDA